VTKRVQLDRLRNISRHRTTRHVDAPEPSSDLVHDEQRPTVEWPVDAESSLVH